jgi:hypothetical protein
MGQPLLRKMIAKSYVKVNPVQSITKKETTEIFGKYMY